MRERSRLGVLLAILVLTLASSGVQADEDETRGHLLLVGGALSDENAPVVERFLGLAGTEGPIGVLPTASDSPVTSGRGDADRILRYAKDGHEVAVLPLTRATASRVDSAAMTRAIGRCRGIWFTDGERGRLPMLLRPMARDTGALEALRAMLERDGVIAGVSAAAAALGGTTIVSGDGWPSLAFGAGHAEDAAGARIQTGLGLFPYGVVETQVEGRVRFGALVAALEAARQRFGWIVSENRAVHVDLGRHRLEAIGPQALLLVDRRRVVAMGIDRLRLRLAVLSDGDAADGLTGRVLPSSDKRPVRPGRLDLDAGPLTPGSPNALRLLIERLAEFPTLAHEARSEFLTFRVSADKETRFLALGEDLRTLCAVGVRLDITATAAAVELAERERQAREARGREEAAREGPAGR